MHMSPPGLLITVEQLVQRNLLLLLIIGAIGCAIHFPVPKQVLSTFDINGILVALIFISQGLKINMQRAGKLSSYLKVIGGGALVAVVLYPMLAMVMVKLFGLTADDKVGYMLMCSFPNSLEAAMAMSASAGGDPITAVVLLTSLNIIGLLSIPLNLAVWLGNETPVSEMEVLRNLIFYLFLPIGIGQALRRFFPKLPHIMRNVNHYLPMLCITALVYISCSKEADLFRELKISDVFHILAPSALLHIAMLAVAFYTATRFLNLDELPKRSFVLITSEKPMSLSVALWSISYADHHPLAIFPIILFYVAQIVIDSFVVTRMLAQDTSDWAPAHESKNT